MTNKPSSQSNRNTISANKPKFSPRYDAGKRVNEEDLMTKEEIQRRFNQEQANVYSQRQAIWLPDFEFYFAELANAVAKFQKPGMKICDLGAGTGNLSRTVLEKVSDAQMTLVDFSENMLSEVPNVLKDFPHQFKIQIGDIFDSSLEMGDNKFDAIISSFAIHHARGFETYKKLYENIYKWLKPHGIFICCDVLESPLPKISELNENGWKTYLQSVNFSESEINHMIEHYHIEDSPMAISDHFEALKEVKFQHMDVIWKKHNFGIYMAIK